MRVVVADGHPVVRAGLKAILHTQPDLRVVGEAADGPTAVALAAELAPDVVVVEVALPGLGGAEVAARLRAAGPTPKVLVLTACEDAGVVRRALGAGAAGYALKRASADEVVRAVRTVAAGGTYLDPQVAGRIAADQFAPPAAGEARGVELSEQEGVAVRLIALGYSNKEIAARLKLSVKTVETYKARAMEKLGLKSRVDLVRYAAKRGWLTGAGPAEHAHPTPTRGSPMRVPSEGGCAEPRRGGVPPLSVLVVEPHADAADTLAELLRLVGHRVAVARTGADALRTAATDPPDVVVLEVRLPDGDGWQVAGRLRQPVGGKRPLVVAVTADGSDDGRRRSEAAGIDLHLEKAVEPGVLLGVLARFARLLAPGTPARAGDGGDDRYYRVYGPPADSPCSPAH